MKRLLIVLAILFVLLAILVGGVLYADTRAREYAEEQAEARVVEVIPGCRGAEVEIDAFPLLWSVFSGEVPRLTFEARAIEQNGIEVEDIEIDVHGIQLDKDVLWDEQRLVVTGIDSATLEASMTEQSVSLAARAPVEFTAGMVKVTTPQGRTFIAELQIEGRRIILRPPFEMARPIAFKMPPESILPCVPQLEILEGRLGLRCELDELPSAVKDAMG